MNNINKKHHGLNLVLVLLVLSSWSGVLAETDDHSGEVVQLSAAELAEFGIDIQVAGPGEIIESRKLPGEVKVNENRLAHIGARYTGIVTKVMVSVGDLVQENQVLAVVESDESLAPYDIKTIIGGTVIGRHLTIGESVSRDSGGFVVADLSDVWIDLTVYQRDLDHIKAGEKVTVRSGSGEKMVSGEISYVAPVVDEHTRTATARLVVDNSEGYWRPGMFVTATVIVAHYVADIVVPETAIHSYEGGDVVFVETDEGFIPKSVELGQRGSGQVEIISGLTKSMRYVSEGGFTLKAELGKGSFDHGHSH